jgi:HD-like signal output (HDOD) protein
VFAIKKNTSFDIKELEFFTPFQNFSEQQLNYIANNSKRISYKKRSVILSIKSTDDVSFFLLEGDIVLKAADGGLRKLSANTEQTHNPLAQLRPSQYTIFAATNVKMMLVKPETIKQASAQQESSDSYSINETSIDDHSEEEQIVYDLIMELQSKDIKLPSLPDIAIKIRKLIEDEDSGAKDIATVVMSDPAIAAKLIKTANSSLYQRHSAVENCQTAVSALGTKTTSQLVISYTLKELFSCSNEMLDKRMEVLWEHSIEVAATCSVLAKYTPGCLPDDALLAGLIHDIGVILILNKAQNYPSIYSDEESLDSVIDKMHAYLSGSILRKWNFKNELIEAGEEAEYWERDKSVKPDYCDLVNMAHLHVYISSPDKKNVPRIDQIPAFKKMALGKLTPKMSLQVLQEAQKQIDQTKKLLQS